MYVTDKNYIFPSSIPGDISTGTDSMTLYVLIGLDPFCPFFSLYFGSSNNLEIVTGTFETLLLVAISCLIPSNSTQV